MSVFLKPHSVTVYPITQATDAASKVKGAPKKGSGQAVSCFVDPMKPSESIQLVGVILDDPIKVYVELADASKFPPQAQFTFQSRTYAVIAETELHSAGDSTDHAVVYASGLQYPNSR